jgi:hypothetical protein
LRFTRGGLPIPFDDVRLSVFAKADTPEKGTELFRVSLSDGGLVETEEYTGEISWFSTSIDTRKLLVGDKNYFEIEVREEANEQVYVRGVITGIGGLNDDEAAVS